jgi:hypothetical protein
MLEILFFPIVLLASLPGTAMIPAAIFVGVYFKRRNRITKFGRILTICVTLLWTVYGVYETGMYFWMKKVIAPIRVDLLLIIPILYLVTIVGTIALIKTKRATSTYQRDGADRK